MRSEEQAAHGGTGPPPHPDRWVSEAGAGPGVGGRRVRLLSRPGTAGVRVLTGELRGARSVVRWRGDHLRLLRPARGRRDQHPHLDLRRRERPPPHATARSAHAPTCGRWRGSSTASGGEPRSPRQQRRPTRSRSAGDGPSRAPSAPRPPSSTVADHVTGGLPSSQRARSRTAHASASWRSSAADQVARVGGVVLLEDERVARVAVGEVLVDAAQARRHAGDDERAEPGPPGQRGQREVGTVLAHPAGRGRRGVARRRWSRGARPPGCRAGRRPGARPRPASGRRWRGPGRSPPRPPGRRRGAWCACRVRSAESTRPRARSVSSTPARPGGTTAVRTPWPRSRSSRAYVVGVGEHRPVTGVQADLQLAVAAPAHPEAGSQPQRGAGDRRGLAVGHAGTVPQPGPVRRPPSTGSPRSPGHADGGTLPETGWVPP